LNQKSTGIFAAAACVLLLCAACGRVPSAGQASTAPESSALATTKRTTMQTTTPDATESTPQSGGPTAAEAPAAANEATAMDTTAATIGAAMGAPIPATAKRPATKAEIVAFFNETANGVKRAKPGYTWTEQTTVGQIQVSNALLNAAVKMFLPLVPQKAEALEPVAPGADHSRFATRNSHPWAGKLTPAMVQTARLTDRGDAWELFIAMKKETRPAMAQYPEEHDHGNAFAIYEYGSFMADLEDYGSITIDKFAPTYEGSTLTYTIDKATGRPRRAVYNLRFTANIAAQIPVLGAVEASVPLTVRREYVFTT
jgi:hypothetical protein